eukprot:jgi/Botrbrau1/19783/Bobra.0124s0031.1
MEVPVSPGCCENQTGGCQAMGPALVDEARAISGAEATTSTNVQPSAPRRFVGRQQADGTRSKGATTSLVPGVAAPKRFIRQQVPDEILKDEVLNTAISVLPSNYNFEIHKTIWRLKKAGAKRVALQFPEGLLMFSCVIADILETFGGVEHCFIMGEVTFGACCVDDYSALALQADFLLHYGHSCLVPVDITGLPCMYIFVDIQVDVPHLLATIRHNFEAGRRLVLAGTIQFATAVQKAREELASEYPSLRVPQAKPLSPGEVLGCTAPVVQEDADGLVFVADGRFHLEAMMIANPSLPAFRYDPYGRVLTEEKYDHVGMRAARRAAVQLSPLSTPLGPGVGKPWGARETLASSPTSKRPFPATACHTLWCS